MSARHVTRAIALYAAANSGKGAAEIRDAILGSTTWTPSLDGETVTNGRLDIGKLMANSTPPPTPTPTLPPTATLPPTVTPTAAPLPAAPSGLTASAVSRTQVDLAWSDNSSNETGFRIERSTDGTTFSQVTTVSANVTTYSNTGLSRNRQYYYRVRANGSAGSSAYSNVATARTLK